MFYSILKSYARLALRLYCRRVVVNRPEVLQRQGPVLFAANHPNSFLDGVILSTLYAHSLYSLARGDVFRRRSIDRFLRRLRLLPVYRTSEGVENLEQNYVTFSACRQVFREGSSVLIFSEGRCENEWHLRPLKKGTARLATASWREGIDLTVIPLGYNYSSFKGFGKDVHLLFGTPITRSQIDGSESEGKQWLQFNGLLEGQLQQLVYEIRDADRTERRRRFSLFPRTRSYFLLLPALVGFLLHAPLYLLASLVTAAGFRNNSHYDSVETALLVLGYPPYLLLLLAGGYTLFGPPALLLLLLSPLTARAALQVKVSWDL